MDHLYGAQDAEDFEWPEDRIARGATPFQVRKVHADDNLHRHQELNSAAARECRDFLFKRLSNFLHTAGGRLPERGAVVSRSYAELRRDPRYKYTAPEVFRSVIDKVVDYLLIHFDPSKARVEAKNPRPLREMRNFEIVRAHANGEGSYRTLATRFKVGHSTVKRIVDAAGLGTGTSASLSDSAKLTEALSVALPAAGRKLVWSETVCRATGLSPTELSLASEELNASRTSFQIVTTPCRWTWGGTLLVVERDRRRPESEQIAWAMDADEKRRLKTNPDTPNQRLWVDRTALLFAGTLQEQDLVSVLEVRAGTRDFIEWRRFLGITLRLGDPDSEFYCIDTAAVANVVACFLKLDNPDYRHLGVVATWPRSEIDAAAAESALGLASQLMAMSGDCQTALRFFMEAADYGQRVASGDLPRRDPQALDKYVRRGVGVQRTKEFIEAMRHDFMSSHYAADECLSDSEEDEYEASADQDDGESVDLDGYIYPAEEEEE